MSPTHRNSRRTTVNDLTVVAQIQAQADKTVRHIAHANSTNESARCKLDRVRKALSEIITLLEDTQETLNTSWRNVKKSCTENDNIQASLQLLKEKKGCNHCETQLHPNSELETTLDTQQDKKTHHCRRHQQWSPPDGTHRFQRHQTYNLTREQIRHPP